MHRDDILTTPKGTKLPLLNLKGKPYLQVAHRVLWFREERPDWGVETHIVSTDATGSTVRAEVFDETGTCRSSAHKHEDKAHFPDHLEKAETGAIGRALALVGYGTQFAPEIDEGERVVDSPIRGAVYPEQPPPEEGIQNKYVGYRIPFGKFAKRSLEEISLDDLRSYVIYIEDKAHKDNKPITGNVLDFVQRATAHIAAFENGNPGGN